MDSKTLEMIVALAEERSIVSAAERLNVSVGDVEKFCYEFKWETKTDFLEFGFVNRFVSGQGMEVYKKALSEIQRNPHLLFEFSLQYSHNSKTAEPIILFKSYNLFWQMKFLKNALLRVQFFNDKDQKELDEGKATPSLAGDFYHQKNQIWDQFIKTVENLSKTLARK